MEVRSYMTELETIIIETERMKVKMKQMKTRADELKEILYKCAAESSLNGFKHKNFVIKFEVKPKKKRKSKKEVKEETKRILEHHINKGTRLTDEKLKEILDEIKNNSSETIIGVSTQTKLEKD